ncbi:membrane bound O-acyl transferase family-domain-containing protein [Lentinula raphanica]|nr:membrane bound O-acyl transferase family-domain-containing protein [Lentinula raphanica]
MDENTPPATAHPLPFSIVYILIPALMVAGVLAFKTPTWMRLLFFAWYTKHLLQGMSIKFGNSFTDNSNGSTLGGELTKTFYLLFFVDPVHDWYHRTDGKKRIASRPWWQRIYWCFCASYSVRGVGWNYQIAGVPPPVRMNRYMFLGRAAVQVLASFLLLDASQCIIKTIPFFTDPQPDASMWSYSYHIQVFYGLLFLSVPYASLKLYYYLGAFLAVLTGYSSQEDWPDFFGNWIEAYSVRNFWGRVWHQMLRGRCTAIGRTAAKYLGAPPGSASSYSIQLLAAFLVSGIMHSFGDYSARLKYPGITLPFYMLQPFAIMLEELFFLGLVYIKVDKKIYSLPTPVKRCFGYFWTLMWLTYSSSWYIDPVVQAGSGRDEILPISVIRYVQAHFQ